MTMNENNKQAEPVAHAVIAGVLFDFMGWLTSRDERLVLSARDLATPAGDALKRFAELRGFSLNSAKVQDWQNYTHPAQPVQPAGAQGVVVGWIFEDDLSDEYPYDALFPYSKVDVVRMFPVFAPSPAAAINEQTLSELKNMVRAYVRLLEAGKDRIQSLGGDCDPVDRMEAGDSNLTTAKAAIAAAEAEKAKGGV